jgi:hypothetical protein
MLSILACLKIDMPSSIFSEDHWFIASLNNQSTNFMLNKIDQEPENADKQTLFFPGFKMISQESKFRGQYDYVSYLNLLMNTVDNR